MTARFCRGGGESSVGSNVGLRVSGSCGKERGINGSSNLPGTGRGMVSGDPQRDEGPRGVANDVTTTRCAPDAVTP